MSSSDDLSVGLFILSVVFLVGLLGGAKFYQLTSSLEELEKKSYQECIKTLENSEKEALKYYK